MCGSNKKSAPRGTICKNYKRSGNRSGTFIYRRSLNARRKEARIFLPDICNLGPDVSLGNKSVVEDTWLSSPPGVVFAERLTIAIIQTSPVIVHGAP